MSSIEIGWVFHSKEMQMGQIFWLTAAIAVGTAVIGVRTLGERPAAPGSSFETAFVEPDVGEPQSFFISSSGSALASAAFGLSALQPETYNGEIVLDIIKASPLEQFEKRRLQANLEAAEAGKEDLHAVLTDVRILLAVD